MTGEQLTAILERQQYRFAKTMPWCPHWYTLRKTWESGAEFEAAVQAIRDLGVVRPWGRYMHIYFEANGWKYWTMGSPLAETILINRAKIE